MKKIFLLIAVIAITVILLPLLGNRVVQNELNNRIDTLTSYGLQATKSVEKVSYFNVKRHYEFMVEDAKKFSKYLEQFSDTQLPPYMEAMLLGVRVGVDMEYSNFLFDDGLSIDIYPLSLSKEMMEGIQKDDTEFYKYIKTLLESKGVLYHINYSVASSDFDGYLKDIDEEYLLKDGSKVLLNIKKAIFSGNGALIAPTVLQSSIGYMGFSYIHNGEAFVLKLDDFDSTSNFESHSTYASTAKFKNIEYKISGTRRSDISLKGSNFYLNASSNIQNENAEVYLKSSFDKFGIKIKTSSFLADGFNYDMALSEVDKDSFEELRVLLFESKTNGSKELEKKIQKSSIKLLSKGFVFNIADFSLHNFTMKENKNVRGFKMMASMVLKEDTNLSKTIQKSPSQVLQNLLLDAKLVFSKEMMSIIYKEIPLRIKKYAKEQGDDVVFNIRYKDTKFSINDKLIK
jgi:hypothetical protein